MFLQYSATFAGPTSQSRSIRVSLRSIGQVPPFQAFREQRAFPSTVRGPVDRSHGRQVVETHLEALMELSARQGRWRLAGADLGHVMGKRATGVGSGRATAPERSPPDKKAP